MKNANRRSSRPLSLLVSAALALVAAGAGAGCAGGHGEAANARLPVRQERATIVITGQGSVHGGEVACTSASSAVCTAHFDDLWATLLEAEPAAGWRFVGWERVAAPSLGSSPGEPEVIYTASFEPEAHPSVAKNELR